MTKNEYPKACRYFESHKRYNSSWRVENIEILRSEYNHEDQTVMYEYRTILIRTFLGINLKKKVSGMRFMPVSKCYCEELEYNIL